MDLREAIEYRIMRQFMGGSIVDKFYDVGKRVFKRKVEERLKNEYYSLTTLSELVDDIIVDLYEESNKRHLIRMTMEEILGEKTNEEERDLFKKTSTRIIKKNKQNYLNGIPEEILKNEELLLSSIQTIDDTFYKMVNAARNKINNPYDSQNQKDLIFSLEDISKGLKSLSVVSELKQKCNYNDMDDDEFLECWLKEYKKDIESTNIPLHKYNAGLKSEIQLNFKASKNTIPYKKGENSRRRVKENIFKRIDCNKLKNMSIEEFSNGYDEMIELYCKFKDLGTIEDFMLFYKYESNYNFLFYTYVLKDFIDIPKSEEGSFIDKISKLAIFDLYLQRVPKIRDVINSFYCKSEKYKDIFEKIDDLVRLKSSIVKQMIDVKNFQYDTLEKIAFSKISDETKDNLKEQLKNIDIIDKLKPNNNKEKEKLLKKLRCLMSHNQEILLERAKKKNIGMFSRK